MRCGKYLSLPPARIFGTHEQLLQGVGKAALEQHRFPGAVLGAQSFMFLAPTCIMSISSKGNMGGVRVR